MAIVYLLLTPGQLHFVGVCIKRRIYPGYKLVIEREVSATVNSKVITLKREGR